MHNLLNFLVKNSYWFIFIFLEVVCFYFIFSENSYQRSVFLNSSNEISGRIYAGGAEITSYFGLKDENQQLLKRYGESLDKIAMLENRIFELEKDSLKTVAYLENHTEGENQYIAARVINNDVSSPRNFITINKGAKDSIKVGMGVVSHAGIVGEVRAVSHNFSVIQSLLNADSKFSCKLLRSQAFSPLIWDGENPRYGMIQEYPSHEEVVIGDTVVTSGYSDVFPSGIMVGVVDSFEIDKATNQYNLTIELSTDFQSLTNILVVKRDYLEEKKKLENSIKDAKN